MTSQCDATKKARCIDPWSAAALPPSVTSAGGDRGSCAGDPALLFDFFRQCDRAQRRDAGACVGAILTPAGPPPNGSWSLRHLTTHKAYTPAALGGDRFPAIERLIARHPDFHAKS